jgi:hypothetical protein
MWKTLPTTRHRRLRPRSPQQQDEEGEWDEIVKEEVVYSLCAELCDRLRDSTRRLTNELVNIAKQRAMRALYNSKSKRVKLGVVVVEDQRTRQGRCSFV